MTDVLKQQLITRAVELGFNVVRFTDANLPEITGQRLIEFAQADYHGEMEWIPQTLDRRQTPTDMWPQAKSAIMLALNYGPDTNPLERLKATSTGVISVYALNRDYHDLIKGRLKQLAGWFASQSGQDVKVFVDTAPLMEKPLAGKAGVGWQGKHTNLVSREFGSWLFLGVILTTAEFKKDEPSSDHCGQCSACLDICPTKAMPSPYKIDARRCISYLTIEYHGHIPIEFRKAIGNRIYGCDDCLAVCPWNKFAQLSREQKLSARDDLIAPNLSYLASLDDQDFRTLFSGSPVKRIKRNQFIRNVLIAIGNSDDKRLIQTVKNLLPDESIRVRAMAVWALSQLLSHSDFEVMKTQYSTSETNEDVLKEWNRPHKAI